MQSVSKHQEKKKQLKLLRTIRNIRMTICFLSLKHIFRSYNIFLVLNVFTLKYLIKSNEFAISWSIKIIYFHLHWINQ